MEKWCQYLGLPLSDAGAALQKIEQDCLEMVRAITPPTRIIHGDLDTLVPFYEAQKLYKELGSKEKDLVSIPGADHNTVLSVGFDRYFGAVKGFTHKKDGLTT